MIVFVNMLSDFVTYYEYIMTCQLMDKSIRWNYYDPFIFHYYLHFQYNGFYFVRCFLNYNTTN